MQEHKHFKTMEWTEANLPIPLGCGSSSAATAADGGNHPLFAPLTEVSTDHSYEPLYYFHQNK